MSSADASLPLDPNIAIAAHIFALADGPLPLVDGLRAVANEAESRRTARRLRQLADALDRGESLDAALQRTGAKLPADIRGLLSLSQQAGKSPGLIFEWMANRQAVRAHWRQVQQALAYPVLTSIAALIVIVFLALKVAPQFRALFADYQLQNFDRSAAILRGIEAGTTALALLVGISVVAAIGIRVLFGAAAWSRVELLLPIIGEIRSWASSIELLRGLQLLLGRGLPLPTSLQVAEVALSDRWHARIVGGLTKRIERGEAFSQAVEQTHALPGSALPLIRSGERNGGLAEHCGLAAELLEVRLRERCQFISSCVPPLIFLGVAVLIGGMFYAMYTPMIGLIRGLS